MSWSRSWLIRLAGLSLTFFSSFRKTRRPTGVIGIFRRIAQSIPKVIVSIDKDGRDASASAGDLRPGDGLRHCRRAALSGGITDGRGHEGDNDGLFSVMDVVRLGRSGVVTTPVYGCSLGISSNTQH